MPAARRRDRGGGTDRAGFRTRGAGRRHVRQCLCLAFPRPSRLQVRQRLISFCGPQAAAEAPAALRPVSPARPAGGPAGQPLAGRPRPGRAAAGGRRRRRRLAGAAVRRRPGRRPGRGGLGGAGVTLPYPAFPRPSAAFSTAFPRLSRCLVRTTFCSPPFLDPPLPFLDLPLPSLDPPPPPLDPPPPPLDPPAALFTPPSLVHTVFPCSHRLPLFTPPPGSARRWDRPVGPTSGGVRRRAGRGGGPSQGLHRDQARRVRDVPEGARRPVHCCLSSTFSLPFLDFPLSFSLLFIDLSLPCSLPFLDFSLPFLDFSLRSTPPCRDLPLTFILSSLPSGTRATSHRTCTSGTSRQSLPRWPSSPPPDPRPSNPAVRPHGQAGSCSQTVGFFSKTLPFLVLRRWVSSLKHYISLFSDGGILL